MASNTLGEFSDGEDDFVFDMDENVWKNSGREWSDPEADELIHNINEEEILARVYGNKIREKDDENSWSDLEVDDLIRNINEEELLLCGNDDDHDFQEVQTGRGQKRRH